VMGFDSLNPGFETNDSLVPFRQNA